VPFPFAALTSPGKVAMRKLNWVAVAIALTCSCVEGCSSGEVKVRDVGDSTSIRGVGHEQPVPASVIALKHDFGVIQPKGLRTCSFEVVNPSQTTWTFSHFQTSCRCTVAEVSQEVIAPGGKTRVDLSYKPPDEVMDDHRTVSLVFKGVHAPKGV
jgi:hypothetical protein